MFARALPLSLCAGLLSLFCASGISAQTPSSECVFSGVPLAFEENDGQFAAPVTFLGRAQNYSVDIERDGLRFRMPKSEVEVRFKGSSGGNPVPLSGVAYWTNYFSGNNPEQWKEGIPSYFRVGIRALYEGISAEYYAKNGELEHDLVLAPGADAGQISLALKSAQPAQVTSEGDIVIPAENGELRFRKPMAFQYDSDGKRMTVPVSYLLAKNELRFAIGAYDHSRTLVIDPVILFATYVSGGSGSTPAEIAMDGSGTIFMTGSTPSNAGFPSATTNSFGTAGSTNVFVAAMDSTKLGSALKWITFLGAGTGTSLAYSSFNSGTLYVGGQTNQSSFPGVTTGTSFGGTFPSGGSSNTGFVTSLVAATGTGPVSSYIASSGHNSTATDTTLVTGLAANSSGDVYIAGYGLGVGLALNNSLGDSGTSRIYPAAAGTTNNAFVLELDATLSSSSKLVTYLQSKTAGDYKASAIKVDASGNIYVAGTAGGSATTQFPSAQSFAGSGTLYTAGNDYPACSRASTTSAFLAQIVPPSGSATNSTLGFSVFTCGSVSEQAPGMALGARGVYLAGLTTSPDLDTHVQYSNTANTAATATFSGGMQTAFAAGNMNGFAIKAPLSGGVVGEPSAFTYLGGTSPSPSGDTRLTGIAVDDATHLVQVAGQTAATRATLPGTSSTTGKLPSGQDQSADNARGLLYTFDDSVSPFLHTVKSISYFGNAGTNSSLWRVLADGAGGAYVLEQDTPTASATSFTSADAIGTASAGSVNTSLAYVQGTDVTTPSTLPGLNFTASTNSPSIDGVPCSSELACEIGYTTSNASTVSYSWDLKVTNGQADDVVLNFPEQDAFTAADSTHPVAYAIKVDGSTSGFTCFSKQNNNGTTCLLGAVLAGPHTVTLDATAGSGTQTLAGSGTPTFTFDGNAADAEGEYSDGPQTVITAAKPVTLTLSLTQNNSTIDASLNNSDVGGAGHTTQVIYTATVTNTSSNDSPYTILTITPPSTAAYYVVPGSVSTVVNGAAASGCQNDGSGCTHVDIPAGKALTYSFTVQYLSANLSTTTAGPYAEMVKADAKALPLIPGSSVPQQSVTTNVNGYAALSVTIQEPTGAPFNMGDTKTRTYQVTVTNGGGNAAGSFNVTNTLPKGFKVTSASCAPTNAVVGSSCNSGGTGFVVPSMQSGGTIVYTINGSFTDHGAAGGDAVPTTDKNATVKDSVTLSAPENTYDPNTLTYTSIGVVVQRSAHLIVGLTSSTPSLTGSSYANQPAYNLDAAIKYDYTIQNTGPSTAFNVPLANVFTTPIAPSYVTVVPPSSGTVTCTSGYASCTISSVPGGSVANPGKVTFTFTVTYPDNLPPALSAVPATATNAPYTYQASTTLPSNVVDSGGNAGDNTHAFTVNVYRTANLTLTPTVSGPTATFPCVTGPPASPSPCLYMANNGGPGGTSGINDTATYSVAVSNVGNYATNTTLTIPLPANFLVNPDTTVAFTGLAINGVAGQLLCTYQAAGVSPNSVICTGYIPKGTQQSPGTSTVTIGSKFSTSTVPGQASFATITPLANSTTITASAINANKSTTLPPVTVDRAASLVAVKQVKSAPGNVSPTGYTANGIVAVNLDEQVAGDANGKNDTVQVTLQAGNAGLNDATQVVVTDTLPPYFKLTKLPDPSVATCTPNAPVATGATSATLKCTLLNPLPRGTATAGTGSVHGTVGAGSVQLIYYGKFEDNGRQPDIVPLTANSVSAQFLQSKAAGDEVDLGTDSTSVLPGPFPVMRAAHLHFTLTQYVQPTDAALNPVGGVTGPGIAEAQLGANGGEVINPVRWQVKVTNDGPNIATDPIVNTTLPLNPGGAATKFVNVSTSIEPSGTSGFPTTPASCASGMACTDAGLIATSGSVLYNVDGNFDVNTLTEGNSGTRTFTAAIKDLTVVDSNPGASLDEQTSLPITVVNTPAGANFTVAPFTGSLGQPLNLKLTNAQTAGITVLTTASAGSPALPSGTSPNPPDNGAAVQLYRYGQGGVFYTIGTSAGVSSALSNQTAVCLTSIPDIFQKPERVLMWVLANAPAGTQFNPVPSYAANTNAGDITLSVLPQGGGSYSVPTANSSYPPPAAQPQPAEVCGVINGLGTTAAPVTLALLEPVNFAPYVRSRITAANSGNSQPGKGVTASAAVVDLTISPQNNYDYNDHDPCYTGTDGTTRSSCNDNVQMTTFLFGGGNLIADAQQVHRYFYNDLQANPKPQFNLPAGQPQVYVVLADQLGAQGYKETTSGGNTQVCDPGNPSSAYTPTNPTCPLPTPLPTGIASPPAQTILPLTNDTSVKVALVTGNVGFGGSTGLIPLPQTPTPEAVASVTAGQTAGFAWNWLTELAQVQAGPPTLTLACVSADGTDLAAKGITCNIQQTYVYSTGSGNSFAITAPPAVYVVTSGNTAVGALGDAPLSHDLRVVAAIAFPIGAIPLVVLARSRKSLKLSGWFAVILLVAIAGISMGCGSSNFKSMGGTTNTATPAATYQFIVTATGTASDGTAINIKSYPFAVTVNPVH